MPQALTEPYVLLEETGSGYIAQPSGHDIFYDEAAGLLHIVEGRMVSAVPLPGAENNDGTGANIAPANIATSSALSSTPSLLGSLSTPRSQQESALLSSTQTPEKKREEEEGRVSISPFPTPPPPHHHQRNISDAASIASTATTTTPSRAFLVSSGPPITAVRASLDGTFTALQRSKLQVEFIDHSNGNMFVEVPQNRGAGLHGFFWTDAVNAEFVMVTSMGLELYSPKIGSQGLKYTAFQRLSAVQWFLWSHSTRILVTGCGTSGAKLQSFQFSRHSGVVRLPMLDLTPPWGSPMKSQSRGQTQSHAMRAAPWLLVSPTQVWVLLLYRRVFIAYHDLNSSTLKLYRLYRDATALFAECPLTGGGQSGGGGVYIGGSKDIELSVVEDVLVVHCILHCINDDINSGGEGEGGGGNVGITNESGTALLIDIAGEGVLGPSGIRMIDPVVATPTQLGVVLINEDTQQEEEEENEEEDEIKHEHTGLSEQKGHNTFQQQQQQQKLSLFYPDIALDQTSGRIFRLQIDLVALSETCFGEREREIPALLSFLHRRQEWRHSRQSRRSNSGMLDPRRDPRHVILRVLRRMVNERAAPAALRAAFDAVLAPSRQQQQRQKNFNIRKEIKEEDHEDDDDEYRSVHAKEIALGILAPALQSSSSPRTTNIKTSTPSSPPAAVYVIAALSELFSSCYGTGNYPLHADVASLYLTAYSYAGKEYLLPSLLKSHAQLLDSPELAERLAAGEVLLLSQHRQFNTNTSGIASTSTGNTIASPRGQIDSHNIINSNNCINNHNQLLMNLSIDMWRRLGNHKQVCTLLLQQGNILAAVKHAPLCLHIAQDRDLVVDNRFDVEDLENIFTAAYNAIDKSSERGSTTSMDNEEEIDNRALKYALERFIEDTRSRKVSRSAQTHRSSSPHHHHHQWGQSLSAFSDENLSASPEFLDQQTASLVEALENF